MIDRELIFVIAGRLTGQSLPNRPAALESAFRQAGAFEHIARVERRRPWHHIAARMASAREREPENRLVARDEAVGHPWPFGRPERWFLTRLVRDRRSPTIVWVADPKSAAVFRDLRKLDGVRPLLVFDAYDAWDLSPLVRGSLRLRAVRDGYRAAARFGDVIFANTPFMADRMQTDGARSVHLLPNGAPDSIDLEAGQGSGPPGARPYLIYVGRIHERVDCGLLRAVAEATPGATLRIVGPVERSPEGWSALTGLPNVECLGARRGDEARSMMAGAAACLVPHVVDDYALSQDAMKAWDALAVGTPVISTPVPPVVSWPVELATVTQDPQGFANAAHRAVAGTLPGSPERRRAFAAANTWAVRAREAVEVIEEALQSWT